MGENLTGSVSVVWAIAEDIFHEVDEIVTEIVSSRKYLYNQLYTFFHGLFLIFGN
jgi:hypothetical protein